MSSTLTVTLLDVGWGDSIFLQSKDSNNNDHFALIDSNDTKYLQPSRMFLRRYFRRYQYYEGEIVKPFFDFILLSHDHADHRSGLENIMREFGTSDFWYPHTERTPGLGRLLNFAESELNKPDGCIEHHEAIEVGKPLPNFGDVEMDILWPPNNYDYEHSSPNDTSVVLSMHLGKWWIVLTGDAEEVVWENIASKIPRKTRFFKVPHHGSTNGTFGTHGNTTWFQTIPKYSRLGISCDIYGDFVFPDPDVINLFEDNNRKYFRTDLHYHVSFHTDGNSYDVQYSHL